ncbi:MAG: DNA-binding protein WhiA [Oscillospiraceae bacterium]|nr:DNA-binding protein WhiA [Oscillospiraceae bacterium]
MESTFSKESRNEALDNFKFSKNYCCNASFLKGYFYRAEITEETERFIYKPDLTKSAKVIKKLMSRYDIDSYVVEREQEGKRQVTKIYITEPESVKNLYTFLNNDSFCNNCATNFLTGVFVSDGILVNPEKDYHLEFTYKDEKLANNLLNTLKFAGFDFKIAKRRASYAVYTKNSQTIEEFLVTVGAQQSCLELMGDKMIKDIRNHQNRLTNCDAANIAKTVKAGQKYIKAIQKLIETELLYDMPEDIQELAQLKLENPELSLDALGKMCSEPMTKSSVNRRLQKLCAVAQIEE